MAVTFSQPVLIQDNCEELDALTPYPWGFCPLLKKSSGNIYLKILEFFQSFIADPPHPIDYGSEKSPKDERVNTIHVYSTKILNRPSF